MSEIGSDKKQETAVERLRKIIDTVGTLSRDIRGKALELTSEGQEEIEKAAEAAPASNVGAEFHDGLCHIRDTLHESLKILNAFV